MVPRARIELATQGFSVLRSTTELPRRGAGSGNRTRLSTLEGSHNSHYTIPADLWRHGNWSLGKRQRGGLDGYPNIR